MSQPELPDLPAPWSYSALSQFLQCPKKFYLTRVSKAAKEVQTEVLLWGNRVHSALEARIRDKTMLPSGFEQFESVASELESWSNDWKTEEKFGLTRDLQPTAFFGKDVWLRGVLDVYTINEKRRRAVVCDYKTGKVRPDLSQLKLFAAATFHKHPEVDEILTAFLWVNHGEKTLERFERSDLEFIWKYFAPQLNKLKHAYESDVWPPKPSPLCGWCHVGAKHCEHWHQR